ncbi:DNA sulfur modification protein DndD [Oceanobacillus kapialis]|uniref:DNA sulfur modification protein DndD n=1 Tax=Oceanobacillus kapialis TaxID=481353 RepID=UPI003851563E
MIFKKLVLNNIGPYEGVNRFLLDSKKGKNTILIGGKNGAGKTTFLNSVRLALYGPLAYGFKTESKEYRLKIHSLLNNKALKNLDNKNFNIKIGFTMVEDFKKVYIEIIRGWDVASASLKEHVEIIKDNTHLNDIQKDNFFEKLRTSFPPSLLELCFFDGEDIAKLSNENNLSNYLKELSTKLFNLDLFQNLEQDLTSYLSQSFKSDKEKKLEVDTENIELELTSKIEKLRGLTSRIENYSHDLRDSKEQYQRVKNDFSIHGGLIYEERNKIQNEISRIENERKHAQEIIKEFIARELPFFLSLPILKKLVAQLEDEENYYVSNMMKEKLNNISFEDIQDALGFEISEDKEQKLKNSLVKKLAGTKDVNIIHNASKTEAHQVYALFTDTNIEKLSQLNQLVQKNKNDLNKLSRLNKKLKDNESTSEFNEMIIAMENYNKKIADLEVEIESLKGQTEPIQVEIQTLSNKNEKIKKDLYNIYKTKSSYKETEKVLNISKKFQESQLRKKVKDVEYFSTKMIKELFRKDLFINRIKLDHQTFKITLLDYDNNDINKDILSAGEKELLVLSIIWGTISSSKKQLPFVLDTLLGRLDIEHKSSVITKLIPKFGQQIIILSTDSEINKELFINLSPYIANEYTLKYDSLNKKTVIEQHFFNNNKESVVHS